jgi:uncharacterized membrane protein YraQ (UPF0718 family)
MIAAVGRQFVDYIIEVLPYLALGFFLSGIIQIYVPSNWVAKHLGGTGLRPLVFATIAGAALPICCIGSLPVAVSLHEKGARLGPVLAFLVATPATSVSALLVAYGLLGLTFTVYIFVAVIVLGLLMGIIGNHITVSVPGAGKPGVKAIDPVCGMEVDSGKPNVISTEYEGTTYYFCCDMCRRKFAKSPAAYPAACGAEACSCKPASGGRFVQVLRHAFVTMPRDIGPEILLGLVLAAVVAAVTPIGRFVGEYLSGPAAYGVAIPIGIVMYTCSTASVPLIHALITQGMNVGAAMALLIVGPVTSWSTILVLRKEFGGRTLAIYLILISVLSLVAGLVYSLIAT